MDSESKNSGKDEDLPADRLAKGITGGQICWKCGETYDSSYDVCPIDGVSLVSIGESQKMDPNIGSLFDERYLITRKLGEGGMGIVYAAKQVDFDREVAIKILKNSFVSNRDVRRRFMYEARTISNLKHPNAVRLYDFGQSSTGDVYMVMEFLVGESLADRLANKFLSYRQIFNMLIPICGVLAEAHNNGVIHRDLKPENIYIGKIEGQPEFYKLLDFGIAKHLKSNLLTQSGILWGTPAYMAPEQILGKPVSSATDIYAMGIILYELISGRLPFNADSPVGIAMRHLAAPVRPLRTIPGLESVPAPLDELILASLNKEPSKRPESMEVFVDLLSSIQAEFFDDEMLDRIPPLAIDRSKFDEWIAEEPSIRHAAVKSDDIYELAKLVAGYEYSTHITGEEIKGKLIPIPVPHQLPRKEDILRKERKTNMHWATRANDSDNKIDIHRDTTSSFATRPIPSEGNAAAIAAFERTFAALDAQKASLRENKIPTDPSSKDRKEESGNYPFDDNITPAGSVDDTAKRPIKKILSQVVQDENIPAWAENLSPKLRYYLLDKRIKFGLFAVVSLAVVCIVLFISLNSIEKKSDASISKSVVDAENQISSQEKVDGKNNLELSTIAGSTVGKNIVENAARNTDIAERGENVSPNERDRAIRSAVIAAFYLLQSTRNFGNEVIEEQEKRLDARRRARRRQREIRSNSKKGDKRKMQELLEGTF